MYAGAYTYVLKQQCDLSNDIIRKIISAHNYEISVTISYASFDKN